MADGHDKIIRPCSDFEALWTCGSVDYEGVVTGRGKRGRNVLEENIIIVKDFACFTMHDDWSANHLAAECLSDSLMAETYTQNGDFA